MEFYDIVQASFDDIDDIKITADKSKRELGFVLRPALIEAVKRSELLYHPYSGSFCHYHKRRDGITTIYEICVPEEFQQNGIGKTMIGLLDKPIQLKCPIDNESNKFYSTLGFKLVETINGKKRKLNVWRLR